MPGFLEGFEPVELALDFGAGAEVGEVAAVDEEVASGKESGGDFGVSVGDADDADGGTGVAEWGWTVGGPTDVEEEVVQERDDGGDGVVEEVVEAGGRCELGRGWG